MANINAARVLPIVMLFAISASLSLGQETQAPGDDVNNEPDSSAQAQNAKTLADAPPAAPKVVCKGDQLTIIANNATLGSVLSAVHGCSGVTIDIPEGASGTRVFDQIGPGPARQVLNSLLSNTDFNFIIGSSDDDPNKIASVLVMAQAKDGNAQIADAAASRPSTPLRRAWMQARQNAVPGPARENNPGFDADASDDTTAAPIDNAGATATPPAAVSSPTPSATATPAAADTTAPAAPAATDPAPATPALSTPEKDPTENQITSMQQMFEQRRQMIANQNSQKPQ